MKELRIRANEDIHIDMMAGIIFETIYSKFEYLVTGVTKSEVNLKSIEKNGVHQLVTIDKVHFKKLLTDKKILVIS